MAVPLEKFVQQLEDSGVLDAETLKDFLPPKADPKSAEDLALELVRRKKVTKFQAEEISKGKGKLLVLGNYVLMEKIGAGGMGQVFKARHKIMERFVAVKVLPNALTKDQTALSRFHREVKAAAKLNHPNIVTAYDADQAGGVHFLVMELVEGSDLSALVKKNGPFPVDRAMNFILQAAKGLEAAHKKGIVHRDIKPANLLLDSEGTVKILDMGLARIHGDGAQAELTNTGAVMGTVDYMAPEQALNTKSADARADIYALGCSLYYLLTAHATYDGDTLMAKLLAHRDSPIPSLRSVRANVPERLEAIFKKMVAKNMDHRYQTIAEVISELEGCKVEPVSDSSDQLKSSRTMNLSSSNELSARTSASLTRQSTESLTDNFPTEVFQNLTMPPKSARAKKSAKSSSLKAKTGLLKDQKKLLMIGGAFLGAVLLVAGIVITLKSKDTKLIVTVDDPDANIEVLDDAGVLKVKRKGDTTPVTISIVPGKYLLKVHKDGFELFTDNFEIRSGDTKSITAKLVPEDAPAVAGGKHWESPEFKKWMQSVAALPAQRQIEAISKKLVELNPGFDGKITVPANESMGLPIEDGKVSNLKMVIDKVTDVSPLRALTELKSLAFVTSEIDVWKQHCPRLDLWPLQGMKIHTVYSNVHDIDLAAVKGLQLTDFSYYGGGFKDLNPVSTMQLQGLSLSGSWPVDSLEPLRGMQLKWIACDNCLISDLSPLSGMPLRFLNCTGTRVADLTPLKGMPLEELSCERSLITDLSPLASTKLKRLTFTPNREMKGIQVVRQMDTLAEIGIAEGKLLSSTEFWKQYDSGALYSGEAVKSITDVNLPGFKKWMEVVQALPAADQITTVSRKLMELNPGFDGKICNPGDESNPPLIHDGKVVRLQIVNDKVTDLSPIRAFPELSFLSCISHQKEGPTLDLSPLSGTNIREIYCNVRNIDQNTLRGLQLTNFGYFGGGLNDLTPFSQMPLKGISFSGSWAINSLEPLKGMALNHLSFDNTQVADLSPISGASLKTLACFVTKIADLSPLRGMPLEELFFEKTPVMDLSPLEDMKLKRISFTPNRGMKGLRAIRQMESLREIGATYDKLLPSSEFWKQFDAGAFGSPEESKPVTDVNSPEFKNWMKEVQSLGLDEQMITVSKKLVELNPGFDGKMTEAYSDFPPKVKDGAFTEVTLATDNVTDISPVRVFQGLSILRCRGSDQGRGILLDLSPLGGMKMTFVDLSNNSKLSDLSPLKGMPLKKLNIVGSQVVDLSSLHGMPLIDLWISMTEVSDLTPLKDLPLNVLMMWGTKVSDLSPLRGMQMTHLNMAGTPVADLSPLKGMPLVDLTLNHTQVTDLTPLKGISLQGLNIDGTGVSDLQPLDGMNLTNLRFSPSNITKGINIIRQMRSLETISAQIEKPFPAAEFWKRYDAGEFGKPQ